MIDISLMLVTLIQSLDTTIAKVALPHIRAVCRHLRTRSNVTTELPTSLNGHLPYPTSASRSKVYEQSLYSWARICDSALTRNFQFCRSIYMTNACIYQTIRENLGSTGCIWFRSCVPYGYGK